MNKKHVSALVLGPSLTEKKSNRRSLAGYFIGATLLALSICLPEHADSATVSLPWLAPSLNYEIAAESGVDHHWPANRIPYGATTATDYALGTVGGPVTSSGTTLPLPSSGHTVAPQVVINAANEHYNSAGTTTGRISGDPAGAVRMEVGGSAYASLSGSHQNNWEGARALAQTTFTGDFISTGTLLDYVFSGQYDRYITNISQYGGQYDMISEHFLTAHLTVNNLSTAGTIFDEDIFALYHMNKSSSFHNLNELDIPIAGTDSIFLTGSTGDLLETSLTVSIFTIAQVENPNFYNLPSGASVSAGAAFDYFDISFTTDPVPLPATVWLFGSGLIGFFGMRRRFKK